LVRFPVAEGSDDHRAGKRSGDRRHSGRSVRRTSSGAQPGKRGGRGEPEDKQARAVRRGRPLRKDGGVHHRARRPDTSQPKDAGAQRRPKRPPIPDDITGMELDPGVRRELGSLSKEVAERVARHLVAAGRLIDDDPEAALEHAMAARVDGYRLGVVREACGLAAYAAERYEQALAEFRAARRLTGRMEYTPLMADCERGLNRPARAIELARSVDRSQLDDATRIELLIVEAGARRDLGQVAAALAVLDVPELRSGPSGTTTARLRYAYADTLEALGRTEEAAEWFARAATADVDGETDADARRLALRGD